MHGDIINKQEIEDRIEELDAEREQFLDETCESAGIDEDHDDYDNLREQTVEVWEKHQPEGVEWLMLTDVLEEMGDADYLIADDYFINYIKDTLEDCGTIPRDLPWYIEIDWTATADNCRSDYSEIEIEGHTYLYHI